MAIFHTSLKTFSRAKGHSATAAAAYRAGIELHDDRTGVLHDYTRRHGVISFHMIAPWDAPPWSSDPSQVWNEAEAVEVRSNARTARELVVALPHELDPPGRQRLTLAVSQWLVDTYGVAVLAAIHAPDRGGDKRNDHAHIMISTRVLTVRGFEAKVRVLDDRKSGPIEVQRIRAKVAELTNRHLQQSGRVERVDHRTLAQQSIAAERRGDIVGALRLVRTPTKHEGSSVTQARRIGKRPEVVVQNDQARCEQTGALRSFLDGTRQDESAITMRRPSPPINRRSGARLSGKAAGLLPVRGHVSGMAWATGNDADLLNSQAQSLRDSSRTESDMSHAYQAMLAEVIGELGSHGLVVKDYGQLHGFSSEQTLELSQHARDPQFGRIARQALRAEQSRQHAESLPARRSRRYGKSMVRTAEAARALRQSEEPVPRNRRAWAKLRREQKAALEAAQRHEARAVNLAGHEAIYRAKVRAQAAKDRVKSLEAARQLRFPISGERAALRADSSEKNEQLNRQSPLAIPTRAFDRAPRPGR